MINQIILTLSVPSVEETAAWYKRVLGWQGHFDTFDEAGHCLFGSVMLQETPFAGFNLVRITGRTTTEACDYCASWIYVEDVDAIYRRVTDARWPVETAPENQFWGERLFRLRDLNGNHLVITQSIEEIGLDEIRERHAVMRDGVGHRA
jgi:uncharacterized glyoxalase superfamily protein PhnB